MFKKYLTKKNIAWVFLMCVLAYHSYTGNIDYKLWYIFLVMTFAPQLLYVILKKLYDKFTA